MCEESDAHSVCCGLLLALLVATTLASSSVRAAEEPPKKTFFLPKSPTAAAYVLGRLSNKELAEAPRSEYVYVALLQRKGIEKKYRLEALEGLAKVRHTDLLTEMLAGLASLDKRGEEAGPVLQDLLPILLQFKPEELTAKRPALEGLATQSQLPLTRQIGFAALVTGDALIERAWKDAQTNPQQFVDLLLSFELIRNPALRAGSYAKVESLLHRADPPEVRRAAITAVTTVPGHEAETFKTLAGLVEAGAERSASISSLQRIPKKTWPPDQVQPLLDSLLHCLQKVPTSERSEPDFVNAVQFATDLASLLPPEKANLINKTLRALGTSVFLIRTIPDQMLFDKQLVVVEAGKAMEIILQNADMMPHNLVIVAPGSLEEIGAVAEKMPPEPDAQGRLYVPNSPKVLHATKMVDPGQKTKLAFTAPDEPGEYQYLCSYPGHWRRMVGIMTVVKDVEAYLASHPVTEPKLVEWKVEDLASDLAGAGSGRNLENGQQLFTRLACAQCHKFGQEGNSYGPELTDVFKRYQNDRADVLRQILEPSLVISNRYRTFEFELKDGDTVTGMIVKEEADRLTLQTGPADTLIQNLNKSDIRQQQPQSSSVMPLGLLGALSKQEILDLLAFLESAGNLPPRQHHH